MSKQENIELFKELWYSRGPAHERNADTGEDMFWGTAELVAREYAQATGGGGWGDEDMIDFHNFIFRHKDQNKKMGEYLNEFKETLGGVRRRAVLK